MIVSKLPSEIVQGDKTGDPCLLDAVKEHIRISHQKPGNAFAGLVHRIDRPVSGCVIFAKTSKALGRLSLMVKERQIEKKYWAVVRNRPPDEAGTLEHYLWKNAKLNKSFVADASRPDARKATLEYRIIEQGTSFFLLEINLLTGRHHQIRTQLSAIGCPIAGDLKYGDTRTLNKGAIALHSRSLRFIHPVNKQLIFVTAPPPDDMPWKIFNLNESGVS